MPYSEILIAVKINSQYIIANYFRYISVTFITLLTVISHRKLPIRNLGFLSHCASAANFYFHASFFLTMDFFALAIHDFTILVSVLELCAATCFVKIFRKAFLVYSRSIV